MPAWLLSAATPLLQVTSTSLLLRYYSDRANLWPLVAGILKEVAIKVFKHEVEVGGNVAAASLACSCSVHLQHRHNVAQVELVSAKAVSKDNHDVMRVTFPHIVALESWGQQESDPRQSSQSAYQIRSMQLCR